MEQEEKLLWLIKYLLKENEKYSSFDIPREIAEQERLLRTLMNVRPPLPIEEEFIQIQDSYLKAEGAKLHMTALDEMEPLRKNIYLWKGDITKLQVDCIVNAANSALLGCFIPCHGCIDNVIHWKSGVQLRLECNEIMRRQGHEEPVGEAKLTPAYNLPSNYIIHTVGPIIYDEPTSIDKENLGSCYTSALQLAKENNLRSIAFCCISTGEYHYPNDEAATIALKAVQDFINDTEYEIEVIFNVFKDIDFKIYKRLLSKNREA